MASIWELLRQSRISGSVTGVWSFCGDSLLWRFLGWNQVTGCIQVGSEGAEETTTLTHTQSLTVHRWLKGRIGFAYFDLQLLKQNFVFFFISKAIHGTCKIKRQIGNMFLVPGMYAFLYRFSFSQTWDHSIWQSFFFNCISLHAHTVFNCVYT